MSGTRGRQKRNSPNLRGLGRAVALGDNMLDRDSQAGAASNTLSRFGRVDCLLCGAGATTRRDD